MNEGPYIIRIENDLHVVYLQLEFAVVRIFESKVIPRAKEIRDKLNNAYRYGFEAASKKAVCDGTV